jgi:hypothetical protein
MLEEVPNPFYTGLTNDQAKMVPRAFTAVAGEKTPIKLQLANAMLVDWQLNDKKVNSGSKDFSGCPYYQPSTNNGRIRSFFGFMSKYHDWKYTTGCFVNFEGCLSGVISTLYEQRRNEYVSKNNQFFSILFQFYIFYLI